MKQMSWLMEFNILCKNISLNILASSLKDIYQKNFSAIENPIQFDAE